MVSFDDGSKKVQCHIAYSGQSSDDPDTWTMNNTTARDLKKLFNSDLPSDWLNKVVPIEVSKTQKGYAIYLDKLSAGTAEPKQEEL